MNVPPRLTVTQLAVLEHLAVVAIQQKYDARRSHKKFEGGWTHVPTTRVLRGSLLNRLLHLNLVMSRCRMVRITKSGVEALERHLGHVILL